MDGDTELERCVNMKRRLTRTKSQEIQKEIEILRALQNWGTPDPPCTEHQATEEQMNDHTTYLHMVDVFHIQALVTRDPILKNRFRKYLCKLPKQSNLLEIITRTNTLERKPTEVDIEMIQGTLNFAKALSLAGRECIKIFAIGVYPLVVVVDEDTSLYIAPRL